MYYCQSPESVLWAADAVWPVAEAVGMRHKWPKEVAVLRFLGQFADGLGLQSRSAPISSGVQVRCPFASSVSRCM